MTRKALRFCLWNIFGALFAGTLLYIFFRQNTYLHTFLRTSCAWQPPFIQLRCAPGVWLTNYLGDFLWAYALSCTLYILLRHFQYTAVLVFVCTTMLGTALELLQKIGRISGTFDWGDIIAEATAAALAAILIQVTLKKEC